MVLAALGLDREAGLAAVNAWLLAGGALSALASALHLGCIVGGPAWYRFFGAGERFARAAARGSPVPALITLGIATVLAAWAAYAFSGAGLIPRLPLLRLGLAAITAVYLTRAVVFIPALALKGLPVGPFAIWSSLFVLVYGVVHAVGLWQAWDRLG